jgi:germination protein M
MKRCFCIALAAIFLISSGCALPRSQETTGNSVTFYYENRDAEQLTVSDSVGAEARYDQVASLWDLFTCCFAGPESEELISPFPAGTQVLDVQTSGDHLLLKLSGEFFTLTGVDMSIASYCLGKTVCDYMNLAAVSITDETESIQMEVQPDRYSLSGQMESSANESFTLYFPQSDYRYLVAETRDVTLSDNETEMAYLMRKLMEGPESAQLSTAMPEGAQLLDISCADSICTVNFSSDFYDNRLDNSYGAYMTIFSIVDTLTGLDGIDAVTFLVEGQALETYGVFQLDRPISRNSGCIGPVRTASGELDADIYVLNEETRASFAVPCRVKQTISQPLAQAVIEMALSYEPPEGFYNPIPYGTELLSISVSGGVCYVDLSDKFVPQEDTSATEQAAVWALVMALTTLDEIDSVLLTINGESSGLSFVDITEPLTRQMVADR